MKVPVQKLTTSKDLYSLGPDLFQNKVAACIVHTAAFGNVVNERRAMGPTNHGLLSAAKSATITMNCILSLLLLLFLYLHTHMYYMHPCMLADFAELCRYYTNIMSSFQVSKRVESGQQSLQN